jgi:hypothetical protein
MIEKYLTKKLYKLILKKKKKKKNIFIPISYSQTMQYIYLFRLYLDKSKFT